MAELYKLLEDLQFLGENKLPDNLELINQLKNNAMIQNLKIMIDSTITKNKMLQNSLQNIKTKRKEIKEKNEILHKNYPEEKINQLINEFKNIWKDLGIDLNNQNIINTSYNGVDIPYYIEFYRSLHTCCFTTTLCMYIFNIDNKIFKFMIGLVHGIIDHDKFTGGLNDIINIEKFINEFKLINELKSITNAASLKNM